ncbi:FAD-dependent oxidoreductase [Rhodoferax sp. OV413]|uniref:hydroxysqualene dehydroxylase n=1 Tax=Rhodoferax sp. OV413 TaxID=1855285 RepID=UPI0025D4C108|nr:FAD-dependent oxidoreductase [Rhodoferax sp. OV413]
MNIAIVGAGWAGLAAAVRATLDGHHATVFEASRAIGGRARALNSTFPGGTPVTLDNGQHILIGAYSSTLELMRTVGVDPAQLRRLPLDLRFADGTGLALPDWPSPLNALAGIATARGWSWRDRWSLLRASIGWQRAGFRCAPGASVADLCGVGPSANDFIGGISPAIYRSLIEPLCVSALNTPPERACGQVFLNVLRDSLFGGRGSSDLLLPVGDLSRLFPDAAACWLTARGAEVRTGARVQGLRALTDAREAGTAEPGATAEMGRIRWQIELERHRGERDSGIGKVGGGGESGEGESNGEGEGRREDEGQGDGEAFDAVIWATSAPNAAQALTASAYAAPESIANSLKSWAATAAALHHESIATVYAFGTNACLPRPMVALRSNTDFPAQFVLDRGQLGGPQGLMAFVVSASSGDKATLERQVLAQAAAQLGWALQPLQTVVEKRATFACTPALLRPPCAIAPALWACGDYVDGPYPATLEGAIRSGLQAAAMLAR